MPSSNDGDKAAKEAKEAKEAKARALSSARAKRSEVQHGLIGLIMNAPLDVFAVSKMFDAGGLRQRHLTNDAMCVQCILQSGFDPAIASMCAIEVGFTDEEWKKVSSSSSSSHLAHQSRSVCV